jgi:hypothetical protein
MYGRTAIHQVKLEVQVSKISWGKHLTEGPERETVGSTPPTKLESDVLLPPVFKK